MNQAVKKRVWAVIDSHKDAVAEFEAEGIETIIEISESIIECVNNGGCVYICGNGGSAADAQHIAAEFVGRFERERKAVPAVAITTNSSIITAISNDYDYERVFARQVEALVKQSDILLAISTSGTSASIIGAAEAALEKGARVLAFTGRSRSRLEELADICFCANQDSTARSQEIHQLGYHIMAGLVEEALIKSQKKG